ncbi:membrane bound O-acyl transferase family-domain-containing protein [Schizophyllum commune]
MTERLYNPQGLVALCEALMLLPIFLVIATRPPAIVRLLILAAQLLLADWVNKNVAMEDIFSTYSMGTLLCAWMPMTAIHFYFIADPLADGTRHMNDKQKAKDMPLLQRVWWAACLVASFRGVGWNKQVCFFFYLALSNEHRLKHVQLPHLRQVPKGQSRGSYVIEHSLWLIVYCLISDLVALYVGSYPYGSTPESVLFQVLNCYACWIKLWVNFAIQYETLAVLCVASGVWAPQLWPPMFGSFWDAYTVRRTWGRVWHGILRRFVSSYGKWLTRAAGATPGTKASSYIQLYAGFVVSGLLHEIGDRQLDRNPGKSMRFFILQALWITFEDGIIGLGKRLGVQESSATRTIGRLSTFIWFAATTPPELIEVMLNGGKSAPSTYLRTARSVLGLEGKLQIPWSH